MCGIPSQYNSRGAREEDTAFYKARILSVSRCRIELCLRGGPPVGELGNYLDQERLVLSQVHIAFRVCGKLWFASTLSGKETESDHLALF